MNGARDNLFIHAQRMQEVERQLNPLKKAAENAIKYREIYSELRRHETNLYIVRHDGAEGEKNKISDKKQKIDDRVAFLSNRMDELLQEYQNCRKELDEADVTLQELNDRIRRYEE